MQQPKAMDREAFEFWKKDPVTQSVMRALGLAAQDIKLDTLSQIWSSSDITHGREIMTVKETGKAQVDVISLVINLNYDEYASYFEEKEPVT